MTNRNRATTQSIIPHERIEGRIFLVRGQKVMMSADLAELYGVSAGQLNQAVKRNVERFPSDFMFQLNAAETKNLKSQTVTSSWGGARSRPFAFTEEGVAMLSAVLHSPTAVRVSIQIIRVFVRLRQMLASDQQLRRRLGALERKMVDHDERFMAVFDAIRQLMAEPKEKRKPPVGFHTEASRKKG